MKNMISRNLKSLRKKYNYTQDDIAEKLNVSRQSIAKWESGESTPDIYNCIKLAELFNVRKQTISKSISSLSKNNYIELKFDNSEKNNSKRIIKISEALTKIISGIKENMNTSVNKNLNQYNKYNNKKKKPFYKYITNLIIQFTINFIIY